MFSIYQVKNKINSIRVNQLGAEGIWILLFLFLWQQQGLHTSLDCYSIMLYVQRVSWVIYSIEHYNCCSWLLAAGGVCCSVGAAAVAVLLGFFKLSHQLAKYVSRHWPYSVVFYPVNIMLGNQTPKFRVCNLLSSHQAWLYNRPLWISVDFFGYWSVFFLLEVLQFYLFDVQFFSHREDPYR